MGDMCPIPLIRAREASKHLVPGEAFVLVTDHSCVVTSMREHFLSGAFQISIEEAMIGVWEITISRNS